MGLAPNPPNSQDNGGDDDGYNAQSVRQTADSWQLPRPRDPLQTPARANIYYLDKPSPAQGSFPSNTDIETSVLKCSLCYLNVKPLEQNMYIYLQKNKIILDVLCHMKTPIAWPIF